MKRWLSLVLAVALLCAALFGCKKEEEPENIMQFGENSGVSQSAGEEGASQTMPSEEGSPGPAAVKGAAVTVRHSVAYAFDGVLYGAVAYENTGSVPVVVNEAQFSFTTGGNPYIQTFEPVYAQYDVVAPGDTSYCVLFFEDEEIQPGDAQLTAQLSCQQAEGAPFLLQVEHGYLVENYPGFATLSGALKNPPTQHRTCELNMIYAGFYDDAGELLGVWYFSKNAVLAPDVQKPFVIHLKALPIENLAEDCETIEFRAIGIE